MTSLHEFGIAEPAARRQNLWTSFGRRIRKIVRLSPRLPAARSAGSRLRMQADAGGTLLPIRAPEVVGILRHAELMIRRPVWSGDGRSAPTAPSGRPGLSTASNRWAGNTMLP